MTTTPPTQPPPVPSGGTPIVPPPAPDSSAVHLSFSRHTMGAIVVAGLGVLGAGSAGTTLLVDQDAIINKVIEKVDKKIDVRADALVDKAVEKSGAAMDLKRAADIEWLDRRFTDVEKRIDDHATDIKEDFKELKIDLRSLRYEFNHVGPPAPR